MSNRKRPVPRSRQESARETRDALLRAGIELFAERGLDGPSLHDICARAGKTRGAFYVHFADRDAFLEAVMERVGPPLLDAILGDPADDPPSLATVMVRFLAAVASGEYPLTPRGGIRPHLLLDACARNERVRARYAALVTDAIRRVGLVLAREQASGTLRADVRAEDVASILLAAIVGGQALMELGVDVDLAAAATTTARTLEPPSRR